MILGLGLGVCAAQGLPQARYRVAGLDPELIGDFGAGVFAVNGQAMTFADLFDFSRLSAAWKVNALGHITHVPAGEPRTGHHIWKEGILVPAGVAVNSSNAVQYVPYASNPVGNWTDAVGIESADVDGGFVRLTHTGTNSLQRISVSVTASSSSVFTAQAEFREGTSGEAVLRVGGVDTGGAGESNVGFSYDFGTGVFSPRGGGTAYSAPVMAERSDGIYEMSFQFEATSVSNIQLAAAWNDDTAGLTVDFRNPQITETPYPQQFIPNATASQVTVAAETLSINQAKLSAALGGVMPDAVSIAIDG